MKTTPIVQIQNLKIKFVHKGLEHEVLHGVNLDLQVGQFTALVGESGSGKTVTALSILRLLGRNAKIDAGKIILRDAEMHYDVLHCSWRTLRGLRAKKIAMIFQDPLSALNPVMTVGAQVQEVILAHEPVTALAARERVLLLFKHVGISDVELRFRQYPHQLSGGLRQRVMIAMALACRPEILIADEPTTALDVTVQAQILELLKRLREAYQLTVLFVTHDLSIVAQYADFVYVLKQGLVVEEGPTQQILETPTQAYTQSLLAAIPDRLQLPKKSTTEKTAPNILYHLDNVQKLYPVQAKGWFGKHKTFSVLKDIQLDVFANEILGVVGESGSGKSTLAKVLLKLENVSAGKIIFDGKDITAYSDRQMRLFRPHLQMIFQDPFSSLNPMQTVSQILIEPLQVYCIGKSSTWEVRLQEVLRQVGLSADLLPRYPDSLSGGQCQRVAIARALLLQPKVLIADEATSALDVTVQKQILELLLDLKHKYQMTLVLISHNLDVVRQVCDRVCVMYMGRIMEVLDAKHLHAAQHPYTQSLLANCLSSHPHKKITPQLLPGEIPSLLAPMQGCVFQTRCSNFMDVCALQVPKLLAKPGHADAFLACHAPVNTPKS